MASLQQEPAGVFHIVFRYDRRRFKRSLETKTQSIALAHLEEIEEALSLLNCGRLAIPESVPSDAFILAAGRKEKIKQKATKPQSSYQVGISLVAVFDEFFKSLPDENFESNTLQTMHTHKQHFLRLLKKHFPISKLTGYAPQKYVNGFGKSSCRYTDHRQSR